MPLVSVIIPCYNAHQFLAEALHSIKEQTFKDYEIIIINDGSTDNETIDFLHKQDKSITILHKENGGPASARNKGIQHCSAPIIIALDSDDKFEKTFFENAISILNNNPCIGVVSSYVQEIGNSLKIWRTTAVDDFSFFLDNRIVACCAFRRICWDQISGYDETMSLGLEDWDFWIRITQNGWKVHVIPKPLFFYRKKSSSMMVDKTRPNMDVILDYLINKHQDWFLKNLKKGIIEKKLINKSNLTIRRSLGIFIEKITNKF